MPSPENPLHTIAMSTSLLILNLSSPGFTTVTYGNVTGEAPIKHGNWSHNSDAHDGRGPPRPDPRRDRGDRRRRRLPRGVDRPGRTRGRDHATGRLHPLRRPGGPAAR